MRDIIEETILPHLTEKQLGKIVKQALEKALADMPDQEDEYTFTELVDALFNNFDQLISENVATNALGIDVKTLSAMNEGTGIRKEDIDGLLSSIRMRELDAIIDGE